MLNNTRIFISEKNGGDNRNSSHNYLLSFYPSTKPHVQSRVQFKNQEWDDIFLWTFTGYEII